MLFKGFQLGDNLPFVPKFLVANFILYQGVPVAPLWDFMKGQFVGVLSALDFILILREVCPN